MHLLNLALPALCLGVALAPINGNIDQTAQDGAAFSCTGDAGILQGEVCCEASCGTCGGIGCSGRGNGQLSCCTFNIRETGKTCSELGAAPCIVDDDFSPVVEPMPYQEIGCYVDMESERIMIRGPSSDSMTIEFCQGYCGSSTIFGVQYGIECWCETAGTLYRAHGRSSHCNTPCSGDSSHTCGGYYAMDVFQNVLD